MSEAPLILVADDEPNTLELLRAVLAADGYRTILCVNGAEALAAAELNFPDVIVLDVMMPTMDGLETCRRLRANPLLGEVPILLQTALDDKRVRLEGLQAGADDFMTKPLDILEFRARLRTITRLNRYRNLLQARTRYERLVELSPDGILVLEADGTIGFANPAVRRLLQANNAPLEGRGIQTFLDPETWDSCAAAIEGAKGGGLLFSTESTLAGLNGGRIPVELRLAHAEGGSTSAVQLILRDITERQEAQAALAGAHDELLQAYESTIEGWSMALDLRDKETEGHTQRVTHLTVALARILGFSDDRLPHVRRGALLHDIGKLGVPDAVLLKPGALTEEEWVVMRRHTTYAYEWLHPIRYLRPALDIPYCHHEKWDGSGYPRGLKGEDIPLAARAFALIDVWDALRSDRPYRKAWTEEAVREHIAAGRGTHFDPEVTDIFLNDMPRPILDGAQGAVPTPAEVV